MKIQKKQRGLTIYGKHPIMETMEAHPNLFEHIFTQEDIKEGLDPIRQAARQLGIRHNKVPEKKLFTEVGDVNHQGVYAILKSFPYADLEEWLGTLDMSTNPAVMLMDEISDPHNVGAIIRTAAAAGFAGVLVPTHNQAPVNDTVFKTSAGAVNHIPIVRIGNVASAIEKLKEHKFWSYALGAGEGSQPLWKHTFDTPVLFIVGSEGKGVRPRTLEVSDYQIEIPMSDKVESLNASVSAAIAAYEWRRQQN